MEVKLKQIIPPLKIPITENKHIYLPTIEVKTLVRVWFLLREGYLWFSVREGALWWDGAAVWEQGKKKEIRTKKKK